MNAQHEGNIWTVDIGIKDTNPGVMMLQGQSYIDSDCGFAHATFAAGNGNNLFDFG